MKKTLFVTLLVLGVLVVSGSASASDVLEITPQGLPYVPM